MRMTVTSRGFSLAPGSALFGSEAILRWILQNSIDRMRRLILGEGDIAQDRNHFFSSSCAHGGIPAIEKAAGEQPLIHGHARKLLVCGTRGHLNIFRRTVLFAHTQYGFAGDGVIGHGRVEFGTAH